MTLADLENYQATMRTPIDGSYRGYTIKSMSPPSSGGLTMIQMLKMLERFPLGDASQGYGFGSTQDAQRDGRRDAHRLCRPRDLDGRRRLRAGAGQGAAQPGLRRPARRSHRAGRADRPEPGGRRSAAVRDGRPAAGTRLARGRARRPAPARRPRTSRWSTSGATWCRTPTPSSPRTASACSPATRNGDGSFKSHGFLLNNELTDFNFTPTTNPFTGERRLQRRAAGQAPAQQHDAGDDLHAERRPADRLRLARRLDDHQLGVQRDAESDRPRHDAAGRDRRAAHLGHQHRQHDHASTTASRAATDSQRRSPACTALGYTVNAPATSARCRRCSSTRAPASSTARPTRGARAR